MKLKLPVVSTLALLFSSSFAHALDANNSPGSDIIVNTLQCEAGRVGKFLKQKGLPQNLRASITSSISKTNSQNSGLTFPFTIFSSTAEGSQDITSQTEMKSVAFNLHPYNNAVCTGYKNRIIKEGVGLYDCLAGQGFPYFKAAIEGGEGSISCGHKITLTKKLSGGAKIPIWGVSLGPTVSWGSSYLFDFTIEAPLRKKAN